MSIRRRGEGRGDRWELGGGLHFLNNIVYFCEAITFLFLFDKYDYYSPLFNANLTICGRV